MIIIRIKYINHYILVEYTNNDELFIRTRISEEFALKSSLTIVVCEESSSWDFTVCAMSNKPK